MWADVDSWDTTEEDDELLDELSTWLQPDRSSPSAVETATLRALVQARFGPAPVPLGSRRGRTAARVGRRTAAVALALVAGSASAAAASGGVPFPRPVRAVAHNLGLPVDSPALDEAHHDLGALRAALDDGDREAVRRTVDHLGRAIRRVPDDERERARTETMDILAEASELLAEPLGEPEGGHGPAPQALDIEDQPDGNSPTAPGSAPPFPKGATVSWPAAEAGIPAPETARQPSADPVPDTEDGGDEGDPSAAEGDGATGQQPTEAAEDRLETPGPAETPVSDVQTTAAAAEDS